MTRYFATIALLPLALAGTFACAPADAKAPAHATAARPRSPVQPHTYTKPDDATLRKTLTPIQYEVTQRHGTEPPFRNAYWDNHQEGLYVDVVTGEPLFSSRDKFDSGTGWPSFTRPVEAARVTTHSDRSYGMVRIEVLSAAGASHLGHVFDDGPPPTRQRYCINSAALRFVPLERLEAEGYGAWRAAVTGRRDAPTAAAAAACAPAAAGAATADAATGGPGCAATMEEIVLAGGCFWGMEELLRAIPGVLETEVGYTGGSTPRPTYAQVKRGDTGHAEAVRIVFDPKLLPLDVLLSDWFFRMHDPTTVDRQGNDVGSQYRSAIFVVSPAQRAAAERAIAAASRSGRWKRPIATRLEPAGPFTPAEDYHQDYLQKNPGGYTCHWLRD